MSGSIIQKSNSLLQSQKKEDALISKALVCLENRLRYHHSAQHLTNLTDVYSYVRLQLAEEQDEVFAALFLNSTHHLIGFEKLFHGTINAAAVYPRKVVRRALECNAAKIIIAHNHPSGNCSPSQADHDITHLLKNILSIVDVHLVDHLIVTHGEIYSFAERGLL